MLVISLLRLVVCGPFFTRTAAQLEPHQHAAPTHTPFTPLPHKGYPYAQLVMDDDLIATGETVAASSSPPPPFLPAPDDKNNDFSSTIYSMLKTGHHKWGLMVYRVWYDDEAAWKSFLETFFLDLQQSLEFAGKTERLLPYMAFPIIEDRDAYDGASKDTIREAFRAWIDSRSVERDGPGADKIDIDRTPRYRFCIYADQETIMSARTILLPPLPPLPGIPETKYLFKGFVVLVDARYGSDDPESEPESPDENELADMEDGLYTYEEWLNMQDDENYSPIDGVRTKDVGWLYAQLGAPSLYSYLAGDTGAWYQFYRRPPQTYPNGRPKDQIL